MPSKRPRAARRTSGDQAGRRDEASASVHRTDTGFDHGGSDTRGESQSMQPHEGSEHTVGHDVEADASFLAQDQPEAPHGPCSGTVTPPVSGHHPVRFVGVCFVQWLADLERVLLLRAIRQWVSPSDAAPGARLGRAARSGTEAGAPASASWMPPLVVVEERRGVCEVVAVAECMGGEGPATGIRIGMTLSQAESSLSGLQVDPALASGRNGVLPAVARLRDSHVVGGTSGLLAGRAWGDRIVCAHERLIAVRSDPEIRRRALERLARCLERWIPVVGAPEDDAAGPPSHAGESSMDRHPVLVGEFTGCARLFRRRFRGERGLMDAIAANFHRCGFLVQLATASTVGAAMAVARWSRLQVGHEVPSAPARLVAIRCGAERAALEGLPVRSLRISQQVADSLAAVGVETVGQLDRLGRAGVAARLCGQPPCDASEPGHGVHPVRTRDRRRKAGGGRDSEATLFDAPAGEGVPSAPPGVGIGPAGRARPASIHAAAIPDVLRRLDQAYGVIPETLTPLRLQEPIVFRHDFDGPCVHAEAIHLACSDMLGQLVSMLHARRESLREAAWIFRHASLPQDLSTDRMPDIHIRGTHARASQHGRGMRQDGMRQDRMGQDRMRQDRGRTSTAAMAMPTGVRESRITLAPVRPSASASHLWSILRPSLERIALDHGVESMVCRVDRSVRLRVRQRRLSVPVSMPACMPGSPGSPMGEPEDPGDRGRSEWIDLVRARLGRSALSGQMARPGSASTTRERAEPSPRIQCGALMRRTGMAPSVRFAHAEPAVLRSGSESDRIAQAIARRLAWRSQDASTGCAQLLWRGERWRLRAIDAWERSVPPWWEGDPDAGAKHHRGAADAGTVFSRLQVGEGLWIFALWPARLPAPGVAHAASDESGQASSLPAFRHEAMLHRMSLGLSQSRTAAAGTRQDGAPDAHGPILHILGAWS